MHITLKLFAHLTDYLPPGAVRNQLRLPLDEATTIAQVIEQLQLPLHLVHLVLVNGVYIPPAERSTHRLREGDALAIWPPIAGG